MELRDLNDHGDRRCNDGREEWDTEGDGKCAEKRGQDMSFDFLVVRPGDFPSSEKSAVNMGNGITDGKDDDAGKSDVFWKE